MSRAGTFFDGVWLDLRYALRQWRLAPGFTFVALGVLSLGMGANLAMFGLFDALVLRPLAVGDPDRLVAIEAIDPKHPLNIQLLPLSAVADFQRGQAEFAYLAGYDSWGPTVEVGGAFTQVGVALVTERYFDVVQVGPSIGRLITAEDVRTAARVAVMTDEYWQRWYARDPHVLGSVVQLEGVPFTIVGVSGRGFRGLVPDDPFAFTLPITTVRRFMQAFGSPDDEPIVVRFVIGRLSPGVTLAAARAQVRAMWPAVRADSAPAKPDDREAFLKLNVDVKSAARGFSFMRDWWQRPLGVLVGATVCVLFVACVNLASLILARTIRRRQESIVRAALGASRWRLVQQELVTSVLLSCAGTAIAIPLAWWTARAIVPLLWMWDTPNTSQINLSPDWRMAAAVVGVVLLTTVLTGVGPALRSISRDVQAGLQQRRMTSSPASRWAQRLLVGQIACAVVLLVGAGLFSKSLAKLRATDLGLLTKDVSIIEVQQQPGRDPKVDPATYTKTLAEHLSGLPGVQSVAFSFEGPLLGIEAAEWKRPVAPAGTPAGTDETEATFVAISPDYLRTMGVPLRSGRDFLPSDDARHAQVAILSAGLAETLFPGGPALGRQIRIESEARLQHLEVVGVSADASLADIHAKTPRFVLLPLLQASSVAGQMPSAVIVRATGSFAPLQPAIRRAVESLGQHYVVLQRTLNNQIDRSLIRERLLAMGSNAFAALATLLVAVGLCGVIGSIVAARTRELGIRSALGASAPVLRRMVMLQAARIAMLGLAIGLPGAWIAVRLMTSTLTDVSPHDPTTFAVIPVGLLAVSLGAAWLPARRAASVDPIEALRME